MRLLSLALVALIQFYRWVLSPAKAALFGPLGRCRFEPTCSNYALEAVRRFGAVRGAWLAVRRVCSCHPFGGCGHDPVPKVWPACRQPDSEGRSGGAQASKASPRVGEPPPFDFRSPAFPVQAHPVPASR